MVQSEHKTGVGRRRFLQFGGAAAATFPAVLAASMRPALADSVESTAANDTPPVDRRNVTPPPNAIVASKYGWDPEDSTTGLANALKAALAITRTSKPATLYIDRQASDWISGPIGIGSTYPPLPGGAADPYLKGTGTLTILFAPGVTLRAKPGSVDGSGNLAAFISVMGPNSIRGGGPGVSGVHFIGYGATVAMNKQEYTQGEWRHAMNICSADDILIEGLTLRDSGGDGIYLGLQLDDAGNVSPYCSNVTIRNVHCVGNRRNGMSVSGADTMLVEGCAFSGSFGTPPEAGIDFEADPYLPNKTDPSGPPQRPYGRLKNIIVRSTALYDNVGYAMVINAVCLSGAPAENGPLQIKLDNVRFGATASSTLATFVCASSGDNGDAQLGYGPPPPGAVSVTDCLIDARDYASGILTEAIPALKGFSLDFTRLVMWNDSYSRAGRYAPITYMAGNSQGDEVAAEFGGTTWTDCVINSRQAHPLFQALPGTPDATATGFAGNITAYDPNTDASPAIDFGAGAHDNPLSFTLERATPPTTVAVSASTDTAIAGDTVQLTFTRSGPDTAKTFAVTFNVTGTAVERYDYDGLSGMAIFAPDVRSVSVPLVTRRPDDGADTRFVSVEIIKANAYTIDATSREAKVEIRPLRRTIPPRGSSTPS